MSAVAMYEFLFIGGPRDAERIALPATSQSLPARIISLPHPEGLSHVQYRRETLSTKSKVYVFYVHESLSADDAIHLMLSRYF